VTSTELKRRRLLNQRLVPPFFAAPDDVVSWLGAVQSQDYGGAKWALAQRTAGATSASIDAAFNAGRILRTHVMRPTWHFVAPADLRWLLALTAPRVHGISAYQYRKDGLGTKDFARAARVFERSLRDRCYLTRVELAAALRRAGLPFTGTTLAHVLMHAELEAVIVSGPRRGKQFTYALFDDRVKPARRLDRDESLATLARRYFTSHGPATIRDFAWWSGLTMKECAAGVAAAGASLRKETVGELTCWFGADSASAKAPPDTRVARSWPALLLPNYDESLIAYKDRGHLAAARGAGGFDPFAYHVMLGGTVAGSWRPTVSKHSVVLNVAPYRPLIAAERRALDLVAARYAEFAGVPTSVTCAPAHLLSR
jgi:hypothetical protein